MRRTTSILRRMRIAILTAMCLSGFLFSSGCYNVAYLPIEVNISISFGDLENNGCDGDIDTAPLGGVLTYCTRVNTSFVSTGNSIFRMTQSFSSDVEIISFETERGRATCTRSSNKITCPEVDARRDRMIVRVRATTLGELGSTVEVHSLNEDPRVRDPFPEDNFGRKTVIVTPDPNAPADLAVTLASGPTSVTLGDNLTYTFKVTNHGPAVYVSSPSLSYRVPPTVRFLYATSDQGGCDFAGDTVTCNLALNPADPSCPNCAIVTVVLLPTQPGWLTATAEVDATTYDPNPGNDTANTSTEVKVPEADLAVTMTDDPDPVVVGGNVTYTVTVTNIGPSTATNVELTDTLPANASLISITPSQGTCPSSGASRMCDLGSIEKDRSASLIVVVSPIEGDTVTNTASVRASEYDPTDNNLKSESTAVNAPLVPDLSVAVSHTPERVVVNQPLTYTITVRNNGRGLANGFNVMATLPLSVTANSNHGFICAPDGGNFVCQSLQGGLPSGDEASFTLVVTPTATGMITNTVDVTLFQTDANPADNTFREDTEVIPPAPTADLSVTVSDSPDPVVVNQSLTYTIHITNNGLATATSIVANLTLPSTVNVHGHPFPCPPAGNNMVCQLSAPFSLPNGESNTLTLLVTPTVTGPMSVIASAVAAEDDPDKNNNVTAPETTTVEPPTTTADLEIISVTDSPDPAVVNDQFTYTITVRNNGLGDATGVMVTNTLPAGVVSDGNSDCPASSGPVIQCLLGNMGSGSTRTISLRVRSSATGLVSNTVSVSAQETDPDMSNNTRSEETMINPANSADVSVSMAATPTTVRRLGFLTYTIVVQNTGPQTATGINLTGFSTASLEISNISAPPGACTQSPTEITCNLGALANGGSATVMITAIPHFAGTLDRTVTVTSTPSDPNLANNSANVSVVVN